MVSAAFTSVPCSEDSLFQGGWFGVLLLHSPGPEIVPCNKITRLNPSPGSPLGQITPSV